MKKILPTRSEISGKIPHSHDLVWDKEEHLISAKLSSDSKTEDHTHELVHKADDTWFLGPAKDDEDDPEHTHDIKFELETKAEKLLKRI